jgi:hypothetical protein
MRTLFLLPLTVLAAAAVAGCGSEETEQSALAAPERDLTLKAGPPKLEVASPVELQNIRPLQSTVPSARRTRRTAPKTPVATTIATTNAPATLIGVPVPVPVPVSSPAPVPATDRELPPGTTVTIIPASSGPSMSPDRGGEGVTVRGGGVGMIHGDTCRPGWGRPRPGIGIMSFPRPRRH